MSNNPPNEITPYTPSKRPTKLTLEEMKDVAEFFRELFRDSWLPMWIVIAGVGALLEGLHILWLLLRYVARF